MLYLLRVSVPDRPGALGALASAIGTAGGDITAVDAIRREIAEAIGGEGPQRWLTIDFTADPRWL